MSRFNCLLHPYQRLVLFNCEVSETALTADFAFLGRNMGGVTTIEDRAKAHKFQVEIPPELQKPTSGWVQKVTLKRTR